MEVQRTIYSVPRRRWCPEMLVRAERRDEQARDQASGSAPGTATSHRHIQCHSLPGTRRSDDLQCGAAFGPEGLRDMRRHHVFSTVNQDLKSATCRSVGQAGSLTGAQTGTWLSSCSKWVAELEFCTQGTVNNRLPGLGTEPVTIPFSQDTREAQDGKLWGWEATGRGVPQEAQVTTPRNHEHLPLGLDMGTHVKLTFNVIQATEQNGGTVAMKQTGLWRT